MSLNPIHPDIAIKRHQFKKLTRSFFEKNGFIEVDTPVLVQWPSCEPHLDPYRVEIEHGQSAYLSSSPEFGLKKIMGSGLDRIYELSHAFRSNELGDWHSREFIMLEWYVKGFQLSQLREQCSDFLKELFPSLPFHCFTVEQWMQANGIPDLNRKTLLRLCQEKGVTNIENMDDEEAFFRLFLPTESKLKEMGIVFLSDYPESQCSYATVKHHKAQRFEVYVNGIEVGNAFEEEKNKYNLRQQIDKERKERIALNKNSLGVDEAFLEALDHISDPISGIAMGWDRLFSLWIQELNLRNSSPFTNTPAPKEKSKTSDMER
jgi:lysyl-tRNA synthetase class 2